MRKILIGTIISVFIVVSGYLLYPRILVYFLLQDSIKKTNTPIIYQVPVQKHLKFQAKNSNLSTKITTTWFEFSTPWSLSDKISLNEITSYQFDNKKIIISDRDIQLKFYDSFLKIEEQPLVGFKNFFKEKELQSEYDVEKYILNVTPSEVTILSSKKEIIEKLGVSLFKNYWYGDIVYSFYLNGLKGFQFIKLGSPYQVTVDLFINENHCIEISFFNIKEDTVDSVLSSIKLIEIDKNSAEPSLAGDG